MNSPIVAVLVIVWTFFPLIFLVSSYLGTGHGDFIFLIFLIFWTFVPRETTILSSLKKIVVHNYVVYPEIDLNFNSLPIYVLDMMHNSI